MTPPKTIGVWKSIEDIRADLEISVRANLWKPNPVVEAATELHAAQGISWDEAVVLAYRWMQEVKNARS